VFGFLGAYFFGLNMLFLRYVRSDLKPKAYTHLVVRILAVCTLCYVLPLTSNAFGDPATDEGPPVTEAGPTNATNAKPIAVGGTNGVGTLPSAKPTEQMASNAASVWVLAVAFIVGVFPQTGINLIIEFLRQRKVLRRAMPSLQEKQTLDELEGVSLYDRTRLIEEGIENIEHLAHHDLVDLVLHTRIPVPRLVDWVDQSILYLHLGVGNEPFAEDGPSEANQDSSAHAKATDPNTHNDPPEDNRRGDTGFNSFQILRKHGIRNATSLERAWTEQGEDGKFKANVELQSLLGKANGGPPRLRIIHRTVSGEQWMPHLRQWRSFSLQRDRTRTLKDFEKEYVSAKHAESVNPSPL
jgi:hypothetical protein